MNRETFKVGAEKLTFKGETYNIVSDTMRIIKEHNEAVNKIERDLESAMKRIKEEAERKYAEEINRVEKLLKGEK